MDQSNTALVTDKIYVWMSSNTTVIPRPAAVLAAMIASPILGCLESL